MSVVEINDIAAPRWSSSLTGGATITRKLKAVLDTINEGPVTIRAHASCPKEGDTYSFRSEADSSFVCNAVTFDARSDSLGHDRGLMYEITATYSNAIDSASVGEDEENPLDDPAVYEFSFAKYQVPALSDRDGNPVINGADEAFDPPFLVDENRPIVTVTRNEASFSPATAVEYQDTVNSDSFAGVDPGVAKVIGISARQSTRGAYSYYVVTYEIEFRWEGWNPTGLLAQGYKYRPAAGDPVRNYVDPVTLQPPASPKMLALDGTISPDPLGDGALPYFHEFNFYREKPFGPLALGL